MRMPRPIQFTPALAALALAALALAGCADADPDPVDSAPTPEEQQHDTLPPEEGAAPPEEETPPSAEDEPDGAAPQDALTQECDNPDGFRLSYPEEWVTNEQTENDLSPCSLFDPDAVDTGDAPEVPADIAAFVRLEPFPFDADVEPEFARVLDREEHTVAGGRPALRLELEATGEGLYPEGTVTTEWRVEHGGETLVATTHDTGEPDYETKRRVLDAMMKTLEFTNSLS